MSQPGQIGEGAVGGIVMARTRSTASLMGYLRAGTTIVASLALVLSLGCGGPAAPSDQSGVSSGLTAPPGSVVSGFALLATGSVSIDDRSQVLGGDVGAAGVGVAASSPTVVVGSAALIDRGRILIGQRVVLRDRAVVGAVRATQLTAPLATVGSLSPFAAPPAVPVIRAVTAGATGVTVAVGQTSPLAAGRSGAVVVHGTLELTGGLYELASLTLDNDAHLVARARSVVRIAQGLKALDRVHIAPAAPLGAGDLRFTVAGTNSGTTSSVTMGTDAGVTALILGAADVNVGDRLTLAGVIAARKVVIGHDGKVTFQAGFECDADASCADASVCTTDSCTDGQCAHVPLANGTACSDANACTQSDACQAGLCVGGNPKVCVALDQCHVPGTCAPTTGICSNPNAPDGTACSDGSVCTAADSCQGGACAGTALTCTTPASCDLIGVCAVKPVLDCVITQADGTFVALFGYDNGADVAVPVAIGESNQFSPGAADRGQPTSFKPSGLRMWVPVPFDGTALTWTLGGATATATKDSPACPPFPTEGDDDTDENGDATKFLPLSAGEAPDPSATPKVASDNLFPLVNIPLVQQTAMLPPVDDSDSMGTLALIDSDLRDIRSTEVVLVNNTNLELSFVTGFFASQAEIQPPSGIAPFSYGNWESGSDIDGNFGTFGQMVYSIGGTLINLAWVNPLIGSNEYASSLGGAGAGNFAIDQVGGGGNRATVFFILRRATDAVHTCPFGTHQWTVDSLRAPQPPLTGFETATGFISTPAKNITGVGKWQGTGCLASRVVGRVVATAHSTDRFFTIDVVLDEFDGAFLTGSGKAVRIEVAPAGTLGLTTNPAHEAIVNNGLPALGSRIVFSGRLLIDHGSFLEVHPSEPIQPAKPCDQFAAGESLPLYCNKIVNDFFTWDSGQPPTPMGRATNRACFLTGMSGQFQAPGGEIHAVLDPATNNWFLTGNAVTVQTNVPIPGILLFPPTVAEASALLGLDVVDVFFDPTLITGGFIPGGFVAVVNSPEDLHAEARCINASSVSAETTWNQGDPAFNLGETGPDLGCYLTRVGGHFASANERVEISESFGNGGQAGQMALTGLSQQAGVTASARCVGAKNTTNPSIWDQGTAPVPVQFINDFAGCFLTRVAGDFEGRGESVRITANAFSDGSLFWQLGGTSQHAGVGAFAQCVAE